MKNQHPTPLITPLTQEQVDRAHHGELVLQRCDHDSSVWYPPSTHCPNCLGTDVSWQPASGRATLWSWVVIHQAYLKAFSDELPYLVAYVRLEEGPLLMSTVVGADVHALRIDQPLVLEFEAYGADNVPMPVFRAADANV
jgi:uncharacterized OB-fold protein